MDPIEVSGVLTVAEASRFMYFHMLRRTWWALLIFVPINAIMLLLTVGLWIAGFGDGGGILPLTLLLAFWIWVYGVQPYWYTRKTFKGRAKEGIDWHLRIDEEGLHSRSAEGDTSVPWSSIETVFETDRMFLIYIGPFNGFRVPKRFFSDGLRVDAWRSMLRVKVPADRFKPPGRMGRYF